jgi:uncharacterized membrane protein YkvA (DUF1232 family)
VDLRWFLGIGVVLLTCWLLMLAVFWLARPKGVGVRDLVRIIPDVLRLIRALIADRATPLDVRLVLVGLLAWIVSPIDLIPEFVPVLGPLDDVVVAVAALRYVRRRLGVEDLRGRWTGSPEAFALLARVLGSAGS